MKNIIKILIILSIFILSIGIVSANDNYSDDLNIKEITESTHDVGTCNNEDNDLNIEKNENEILTKNANISLSIAINSSKTETLFTINLSNSSYNGNMALKLANGSIYSGVMNNGHVIITTPSLIPGNHDINLNYTGNMPAFEHNQTINIPKYDPSPNVNVILDGNNAIINITCDPGLTGDIYIRNLNNNTVYNKHVNNGEAIFNLNNLAPGNHPFFIWYNGNSMYLAFNATTNFIIKANTTLNIDIILKGNNGSFKIILSPNATGNVTIKLLNNNYISTLNGGIAIFNISNIPSGNHVLYINYTGDDYYHPFHNASHNFTLKTNSNFDTNVSILDNGSLLINVILDSDASGNISLKILNNTYNSIVNSGIGKIIVNNLNSGTYLLNITYSGDNKYNSANYLANFTIPSDIKIILQNVSMNYMDGTRFVVLILDSLNNPVVGENIIITLNGQPYNRTTNASGAASIALNLNPGDYIATTTYKNMTFTNSIHVSTILVAYNITKYYKNGTQFQGLVVDSSRNPIKSTDVSMNINGVIYKRTTSSSGMFSLAINLNPGVYEITVDHPTTTLKMTYIITVLSTINGTDIVKYYKNGTQYTAKLVDNAGKALANTDIDMNINGVIYTRKTNSQGIVTLSINLNPGNYIITVTHPSSDLQISNNIKVLTKLYGTDVTMTTSNRKTFDVRAYDNQGNAHVGASISININGVFYNRVTDSNGIAKLSINLNPGNYIATASYDGYSTSNRVVVQ